MSDDTIFMLVDDPMVYGRCCWFVLWIRSDDLDRLCCGLPRGGNGDVEDIKMP